MSEPQPFWWTFGNSTEVKDGIREVQLMLCQKH